MQPLPTMPRRTWLEHTSLALSLGITAIGALTLAGWWLPSDALLQPVSGMAVLRVIPALGFCALGLALLALELGHRRLAVVAGIASLLGLMSLVEIVFRIDLHLDQFLATDRPLPGPDQPGRMPALVAASLVLGGLLLGWRIAQPAARFRPFAGALAGSLLASAGLATLLGHGAGLQALATWGTTTETAPVAAVALCLLGFALVLTAWREGLVADGSAPTWAPMPAVVGCLCLTIILWLGLHAREQSLTSSITLSHMDQLAAQVRDAIDKQAGQMERIARAWGDGPPNAFDTWRADAQRQLAESGSGELGCLAITFVNPSRRTVWAHPEAILEISRGFDHAAVEERGAALALAESSRGPILSATTRLLGPPPLATRGLVIYSPVIRTGVIAGFLAAEFDYERFFRHLATARLPRLPEDYQITFAIGGETVFRTAAAPPPDGQDTLEKTYSIAGRRIRITLTPTPAALAQTRRYLPELLALTAGLGITALLGLSVHFARRAHAGQRAAEHSNRKLHAENEERRRVEARLKTSDERLRLALDSTQIGIIEWSVGAGHIYYSPGLWAMLGYDPREMPSTTEAWLSLVHPEDLPLYSRRSEAQLHGLVSFIDPEYRVRAQNGDWRWVYSRSKSVALGADGRPTRIIGTVQDITARREAEQALRESQAEARKLSLVAAKTDNPVLIGSADGRIEWANEAFCRVMEYSLEEVIGKNPAHFMIGPDSHSDTVARIRSAMARGQGISTDVVNYSKSGRKYHLHIEVQPVHNTDDEVANFIAVLTDITARVETENQLRRAKQEADEASRAKSEFLASMSHEIRTPMNGVIGMTSLLMETPLAPEQRDFVNTIRTSGEALLTIINDILDFSKIESGRMELERSPFDLAACVEEALDLFALQAGAKKLELGYQLDPAIPAWILGDVTRLRQVIVNLVNNAVKFTPGGSVSLEIRLLGTRPPPADTSPGDEPRSALLTLEFRVIDTGIGIPPDRLSRLFKAFSQVDSSTTRKYGGTGLGLAISHRLCELMGGHIRVESVVGTGSTVIFTIQTAAAPGLDEPPLPPTPATLRGGQVLCVEDHPVTAARLRTMFTRWGVACTVVPDVPAALAAASQHRPALLVIDTGPAEGPSPALALAGLRCPQLLLHPFGLPPPTPADPQLPTSSTSKPIRTSAFLQSVTSLFRSDADSGELDAPSHTHTVGDEIPLEVLLAEDNPVNKKVALRFLERLGYQAAAAANGLEAIAALEHRRYDLVLMDVQMPEMDGYEATRKIRATLPPDRQPKIIALTANAMQGDREMAFAAGMDDYISKPVKMHEIAAAIRRHFGDGSQAPAGPSA